MCVYTFCGSDSDLYFNLIHIQRDPDNTDKPWVYTGKGPLGDALVVIGLRALVTDENFGMPMNKVRDFIPKRVSENGSIVTKFDGMTIRAIISAHDPDCLVRVDPVIIPLVFNK